MSKKLKSKKNYMDQYQKLIDHFLLPENKDFFNYKRLMYEAGYTDVGIRQMNHQHSDLKVLWYHLKYIIKDTIERSILEGRNNKDAFAIRYINMMFQVDEEYLTPKEKAELAKLRSETYLNDAQTTDIRIGYGDDEE